MHLGLPSVLECSLFTPFFRSLAIMMPALLSCVLRCSALHKQRLSKPFSQQVLKYKQPVSHTAMRPLSLLALVLAPTVAVLAAPRGADGAGECGTTPPDQMALKLAPCASAAEDPQAAPSGSCCAAVQDIGRQQSPRCLCAVLLSNTVRHSGVRPEVAITIPKRCNLANRPIGYKCGDYTLPSLQD